MYGGEVTRGGCLPLALVAVDSVLALIDGAIAVFAFSQLLRIHSCSQQLGWTRQKMFHLMIGTSNIGYLVYFLSTITATCKGWPCWSHGCGFILMASPQILFLAAFLLLLSFWVDLCHQANDDDDDDDDNDDHEEEQTNYNEALLEKSKTKSCSLRVDTRRKCCPFQFIHVGSRQKFVVLVVVVTFLLMIGFSVLIWIGEGRNPIDSSFVARVYLDVFSAAIFLLGGALACYGGLLFTKMRKVRSEMVSTEMWKVAGLAAVSLVCFTSCSLLALITSVPVIYDWQSEEHMDVRNTSLLLFLYYFIGSSVPSALVLWETREMPSRHAMDNQAEARVVTFVNDRSPAENHPQSWTITASLQNQASRASPI